MLHFTGGMGAAYFLQHRIPRQALGAAAFGLLFITAGQMVDRGSVIQGYNLGECFFREQSVLPSLLLLSACI